MRAETTYPPTIARGAVYGGEEGVYDASSQASGPVEAGPPAALFWVAALFVLILIRVVWEYAD